MKKGLIVKKTISVASVALAVSLIFFISGCGKETKGTARETPKKPVKIKVAFWGSPDELNIIRGIIDNWQATHPSITVRLEHTPYRGYVDKLLTRIAGGSSPDIICTEVDLFVTFQSKDVLLDLTPYVAGDTELTLSDFYPEIIDRFTVNGKLYALPRDTAPFACVYYNKELFDEAGLPYPQDDWDTKDLLNIAKKLTKFDSEGRVVQYGFYAWVWQNFVYAFGGSLADDVKNPTRCLLDSKESREGLQFYSDLINKYKVHPSSNAMMNLTMTASVMFENKRVAMFASGIWETPALRKSVKFNWDVAMFPKGPDGRRAFGTGGSGYCILKTTKHPQESYEVVKALVDKNAQAVLADSGLAQPAIKAVAEGSHWVGDNKPPQNKKMLNEAMKYVIYEPFHPAWREAEDLYINPELDMVFNGNKTVDGAISAFIDKVNNLLKK